MIFIDLDSRSKGTKRKRDFDEGKKQKKKRKEKKRKEKKRKEKKRKEKIPRASEDLGIKKRDQDAHRRSVRT